MILAIGFDRLNARGEPNCNACHYSVLFLALIGQQEVGDLPSINADLTIGQHDHLKVVKRSDG